MFSKKCLLVFFSHLHSTLTMIMLLEAILNFFMGACLDYPVTYFRDEDATILVFGCFI